MKATAQIFLSYAREDKEKIEKLYQRLSDAGFKPWMDKKDILPGERWESRIPQAIRRSDFFLACLSANSISKRGWVQREMKQALDIWQEKLDSDIYLIPVRLESCEVPKSLCGIQWVNLFEESGWTRLVEAIQIGMERRAPTIKPTPEEGHEEPVAALHAEAAGLLEAKERRKTLSKLAKLKVTEPAKEVPIWQRVPGWAWGAIGVAILLAIMGGTVVVGRGEKVKPTPTVVQAAVPAIASPTSTPVLATPTPPPPRATPVPSTATPLPVIATAVPPTASFTHTATTSNTPTFTVTPTPTATATDTPTPTATTTPMPEPGATRVWKKDGSVMIYIPAGELVMGLKQDGSIAHDGDEFRHKVHLDAFWIDKYEVTNAQYKRCVDAGACERPFSNRSHSRVEYYGNPQFDEYPVIEVNWNRTADYCQWVGKRLPTEAEWEYAARGPDERMWPWGNMFDPDKVNSWEGGAGDTTKVDWYASGASVFGVLNMAGNVAEWTADWYGSDYYLNATVHNPQGPTSGQLKVARGGSWRWSADAVRTSDRNPFSTDTHSNDLGFRCAKGSE